MNIDDVLFGRYEVVDILPSGNQAEVVVARDLQTGEYCVIKRLSTSPGQHYYSEERARFIRMAQLRFGHPHILDPVELVEDNRDLYVIMPFIEGCALDGYLAQNGGKLGPDEAVRITRQMAEGLSYAHTQGVIHRDIKPANIMVRGDGHVFLVDFGICRILNQQTITRNGGMFGTLAWMSPGQANDARQADARDDLYAVGAVLYWMLTGTLAVNGGTNEEILVSIHKTMPPSPSTLDPGIPYFLDQICMKLLAKQREARIQTAQELGNLLDSQGQIQVDIQYCSSCGCQSHATACFCPACGHSLKSASISSICLACGAETGNAAVCPACHRAFSPADHRLEILSGPGAATVCRIPEGMFEIGRDQICSRDQYISRAQLSVASVNGSVFIQNVSTTNPTTVNGQPVQQPVLLEAGHELSLGMTRAVYQSN